MANKMVDMTGRTCGLLTVTRRAPNATQGTEQTRGRVRWYTDCVCGTKDHIVCGHNLRIGNIRSCGCLRKPNMYGTQPIDITGLVSGSLVATRRAPATPDDPTKWFRASARWYTDCACGTKDHIVESYALRNGRVRSCGCSHKKRPADQKWYQDWVV